MIPLSQLDVDIIKAVYPVTKMVIYPGGAFETVRESQIKQTIRDKPKRGKIRRMTKQSLIRLMFVMQITRIRFKAMMTLTYPKYYPRQGDIVKSDINALLQKVRRSEMLYLWFLEFQERGAPHVHLLLDCESVSPRMRVDYGLFWTERIVLSDWFNELCPPQEYDLEVRKIASFNCHHTFLEYIKSEDGARNYVAKYASKEKQKTVPEAYESVGRFWGASRQVRPEGVVCDITEDEIEEWLVDNGHPAGDWTLVPKYIWTYQ